MRMPVFLLESKGLMACFYFPFGIYFPFCLGCQDANSLQDFLSEPRKHDSILSGLTNFILFFFQDIIDIQHCINLSIITWHVYCEIIAIISLVTFHYLIQMQKREKMFFPYDENSLDLFSQQFANIPHSNVYCSRHVEITPPVLIYFITGSLCLLTTFIHFSYSPCPTSGNHRPNLSLFVSVSLCVWCVSVCVRARMLACARVCV